MSNITEMIHCIYCGGDIERHNYAMIDVEQEPILKSRILTGRLWRVECPHCHRIYQLPESTVYLDRAKKLLVILAIEEGEYQDLLSGKNPALNLYLESKDLTVRIVRTPLEMMEKIHARDIHLDDRILELAKLDIKAQADLEIPGLQGLYLQRNGSDTFFVSIGKDNTPYRVEFDRYLYDEYAYRYKDKIREVTETEINSEWAKHYVM